MKNIYPASKQYCVPSKKVAIFPMESFQQVLVAI
jgi:hypothetical protein